MLSIAAMTSGQGDYYLRLAREDYYLAGGEPPGTWCGTGAARLGLPAEVTPETLSPLFQGWSVDGRPLVQNSGRANRQPGWDLTFSAPKSVSVLWSQLDDEARQQVPAAQREAVQGTITFLEQGYAFSRVGKQGAQRTPVGLVVALFEHSTSRALDMQLHTHALVMNLGVDEQGGVRAIQSKPFYQAKMLAGAYYRNELARQLVERLGVEIERPTEKGGPASWFEIKGVPKAVPQHFSKRRQAILRELGQRGLESASAAAFAALGTREVKTIVPPRNELHRQWQQEGRALGFAPEAVLTPPRKLSPEQAVQHARAALSMAAAQLTEHANYFTQDDALRRTLEVCQERGIASVDVARTVSEQLVYDPFYVSLGAREGQAVWTTQEIVAAEREFLEHVETLRQRRFDGVSESRLEAAILRPRGSGDQAFFLDAEQQQAVRYITQGTESIKVVSGWAGTGKTEMLSAAKEALEKQGYQVLGTALSGPAARNLEAATGIASETIRQRELQLNPEWGDVLKHHARQLWRAAQKKETFPLSQLSINQNTVLVVDEAGMVGTRDFAKLAKAVVARGGSIVAVGDERQLAAIERPGAFHYLVNNLAGVRLSEIRRQRDPDDRQAVQQAGLGNAEDALRYYAGKGHFYVGTTRERAEWQLVHDWATMGGTRDPEAQRIFCSTRAEAARLNALCQAQRCAAGAVDNTDGVTHRGQTFMAGDRVRFDQAARRVGVHKGERGRVLATKDGFTGKYVAVALDLEETSLSERIVTATQHHARQLLNQALGKRTEQLARRQSIVVVPLETLNPRAPTYQGLSLDYAMTTHLGQGQTVPNSFVLLGASFSSRELAYVQLNRHQEKLWLYAAEEETGQTLTELARAARPLDETPAAQAPDVPRYSQLVRETRRAAAQELVASIQQQPLSMQETPHGHEPRTFAG